MAKRRALVASVLILISATLGVLALPAAATPGPATAVAAKATLAAPPAGPFAIVGQAAGVTYAVAANEKYVVAGSGPRLVVLDTDNPEAISAQGLGEPLGDLVRSIVLGGTHAYVVAENAGFHAYDLSVPSQPRHVAAIPMGGEANAIAIDGDTVYVTAWGAGFWILDVTVPAEAHRLGVVTEPRGANGVAVSGGFAYVSYPDQGVVRTYDVRDPSAPRQVVEFRPGMGNPTDSVVAGKTLYVAEGADVAIVDITDPAAPRSVGAIPSLDRAWSVAASDRYLYVCDGRPGARVFDIAQPWAPTEIVQASSPGAALHAALIGDRVVIADWLAGIYISDMTNPNSPVSLGAWRDAGFAKSVAVAGDRAYLGKADSGLQAYDLSDVSAPRPLGFSATKGQELSVAADDEHAYLTEITTRTLWLYDVTKSGGLTEVSTYFVYGRHATLDGDVLYIARGADGVEALDVSDPANYRSLDAINTPGYAFGTAAEDGYLYVADRDSVRVIDARDPTDLREVGEFTDLTSAVDVAVVGTRLHVAAGLDGLAILDVSAPESPRRIGKVEATPLQGEWKTVAANEQFAFVGHLVPGMQVVDVSDPAAAEVVQYVPMPWPVEDIVVADDKVYAAAGAAGLVVLAPEGGPLPTSAFLDVPADLPTPQAVQSRGYATATAPVGPITPFAAEATDGTDALSTTAASAALSPTTPGATAAPGDAAPATPDAAARQRTSVLLAGSAGLVVLLIAGALVMRRRRSSQVQ